jgi:hypothetical protein
MNPALQQTAVSQHIAEQRQYAAPRRSNRRASLAGRPMLAGVRRRVGAYVVELGLHIMAPGGSPAELSRASALPAR